MNKSTVKKLRIAAITIVIVVFGAFAVSKMNIEPADYTKTLEAEISKAEEILKGIDITKGEYTSKSINEFEEAVNLAKEVLNDEASTYSDKKEAVQMLKEAIERFEKSKGVLGDFNSTENDDKPDSSEQESQTDSKNESKSDVSNQSNSDNKSSDNSNTNSADNTSGNTSGKNDSTGSTTSNTTSSNKKEYVSCTIQIDCHNLVGYENLDPRLKPYVPDNGIILPKTTVKVEKGKSVFDVLNKICRDRGIQVESSFTPMYGSYYVEGINNLYEFDGGELSGWMYKVNGWYPNYGCSEYVVKEGDVIVWSYTKDCGVDLGQPMY